MVTFSNLGMEKSAWQQLASVMVVSSSPHSEREKLGQAQPRYVRDLIEVSPVPMRYAPGAGTESNCD